MNYDEKEENKKITNKSEKKQKKNRMLSFLINNKGKFGIF